LQGDQGISMPDGLLTRDSDYPFPAVTNNPAIQQ